MTTTVEEQLFMTEKEELISGSEAVAIACALADVDVITAYPIRPYDTVMQYVSQLKANGAFDCDFIVAESEHSQFEIVKHASSVGARTFCGSSGVGWFYAFEAIAVTAGLRLPVVAMVGNRALDDPGAFGVEHNDALAVRDLGWMLYWVATAQEALDMALMAWRIAEDPRAFLPMALSCDGSFLTHSQAIVNVPTQEQVSRFLPGYDRGRLQLHPDNPITVAPQVNEDWLMEIRRQSNEAMTRTPGVIKEVYEEFKQVFGRGDPSPIHRRVHDGRRPGYRPDGYGHVGPARPCRHSADAGAGQEGGLCPPEVLPPLRYRRSPAGPGRRQGRRGGGPRLFLRLPVIRRCAIQRGQGGPLPAGEAAPCGKLHCRTGRARGPRTGRGRDGGNYPEGHRYW